MEIQPSYKYGKSITVIARLSGLSACAVSRVLAGRGTSLVNAYRIARAMDITLDEFWGRYYALGKSRLDPFRNSSRHMAA